MSLPLVGRRHWATWSAHLCRIYAPLVCRCSGLHDMIIREGWRSCWRDMPGWKRAIPSRWMSRMWTRSEAGLDLPRRKTGYTRYTGWRTWNYPRGWWHSSHWKCLPSGAEDDVHIQRGWKHTLAVHELPFTIPELWPDDLVVFSQIEPLLNTGCHRCSI